MKLSCTAENLVHEMGSPVY